ncbi:single-stranded DNA-binding protein [Bacteroides ovatus]|uniref:single-stranded DNA-binding protein n=1 Tax=Bacteroides ovatus TaxID=28116 RepID=UPI002164B1BC|nr:single-stranded DNA-binding protein [Bacteroides ovatus]UVQ33172.1 single-stranded DNA-binding protein [Bacteroides ovatus]
MRFTLRNKSKLIKAFGEDYYKLLISSLTTWVSCLKPGESSVVTYLKKGTQVYVRGSLSVKTFNSGNGVQAGVNCLVRELQLLGSKQETQNEQQQPATTSTPPIYTPAGSASPFPPENEKDDLPF